MTAEYKNLVELNPEIKLSDERKELQAESSKYLQGGMDSLENLLGLLGKKTEITPKINEPDAKDYALLADYEQNDSYMNDELCNFFEDYCGKLNSQQTA